MNIKVARLQLQAAAEFIKQAIDNLGGKRGAPQEADPKAACATIKSAHVALNEATALLGGDGK